MKQTSTFCSFLLVVAGTVQAFTTYDLKSRNNSQYLSRIRENVTEKPKFRINSVERPLFIGSYNVQTLGKKKFNNNFIMINLEKVVHRYDLILITELMTNDTFLIQKFLNDVNKFAPEGVFYKMVMNNETSNNEYYAFLYRIDKLRVIKTDSYKDPMKFYRYPFFVLFDSPTLRDMSRFGVIGHHVKPTQAVQEIDALADAYDFMKNKYKIEDILMMGDFNAQCAYVKETDWQKISLWTRPEFTWPIGHNIDTTTNYKSCALDRFVYAGENMNSGVIMSSARSLNLEEELGMTLQEARDLSDHRPIEIKLRGRMTDTSENHLTSESCFNVKDTRTPNVNQSLSIRNAQKAFYAVKTHSSGLILMSNETKSFDKMLLALDDLKAAIPTTFTHEQMEAIMYKLHHGALNDDSSYADEQDLSYKIHYQIFSNHCSILICKTSTIN